MSTAISPHEEQWKYDAHEADERTSRTLSDTRSRPANRRHFLDSGWVLRIKRSRRNFPKIRETLSMRTTGPPDSIAIWKEMRVNPECPTSKRSYHWIGTSSRRFLPPLLRNPGVPERPKPWKVFTISEPRLVGSEGMPHNVTEEIRIRVSLSAVSNGFR